MQIAIKKFRHTWSIGFWSNGIDDATEFCTDIFDEYFQVPAEAKAIWVSLHTRPSAMRHKAWIRPGTDYYSPQITLVNVHGGRLRTAVYGYGAIYHILKRLVGKTVYVQVEYEE